MLVAVAVVVVPHQQPIMSEALEAVDKVEPLTVQAVPILATAEKLAAV
jgi:hypothetical protein